MHRRIGAAIAAITASGLLAGAALADGVPTTTPAPAAPVAPQAAADAAARALLHGNAPLLSSLAGVDVFGHINPLTRKGGGAKQQLAFACAELSCTAVVTGELKLFDDSDHVQLQALATVNVAMTAGQAHLAVLLLSDAQKALVRKAYAASLHIAISVATTHPATHAGGARVRHARRTYVTRF